MTQDLSTKACIVGGGPCGMMLGVLLARAGIDVTVLEKYPDFFRDFRGDTIHPSTLDLLYELGWLDDFLKLRHDEAHVVSANVAGEVLQIADFSKLPTHCKFIAFMPQWDFLNFLAARGKAYPTFKVLMQTEAVDLIDENGRVAGVRARNAQGETFDIRADLVVGTDGRHSTVRSKAGFVVDDLGAPMDVLWMRIGKEAGDPKMALGTMRDGHILVLIDRTDYWQCAFIIPKGSFEQLKSQDVSVLQKAISDTVPELADRVKSIDDWSKVMLLEVKVDRLERWHKPGLLCIGDAAHAMSPIGGIGINLAIQDAVATANLLYAALERGAPSDAEVAAVQRRRLFATKITQAFQVFVQNHAIEPVLSGDMKVDRPPLPLRLFDEFPRLRGLPARALGVGFRPEHVRTPDRFAKT